MYLNGGPFLAMRGPFITAAGNSAPVTPTGGLLSLTIADTTPIDVQSSIGANGSGWVAICVLKGLTSTVGTVVPSALTIEVSDPGYDTSGNVTKVTRTLTGVVNLRRQFPNGNSKMISTDGTDLTIYITLDEWIYENTTIVSASIGGTFYTGCVASDAGTKTNLSATAYTKPLFAWINPQQERNTASTHDVEGVAFHRHATAGQQVPCIKFNVTDGSTTTDDQPVSATALSSLQTIGNIAEIWKCAVDFSTMTQGVMCSVNAKVYPWIGDSSAVLDLNATGVAWPTRLPQTKLRVFCDRTGAYGGGYAYIDGTGAGTPQVSSNPVTAKANPYATQAAAMSAMRDWNNTNKGHNDLGGGTIRYIDNAGGDKTYTITLDGVNAPGSTWCIVEKDPASSATISIEFSDLKQYSSLTMYQNLRFASNAGSDYTIAMYTTSSLSQLCTKGCTFDNSSAKNFLTWCYYQYHLNLTLEGTSRIHFNNLTSDDGPVSWIGVVSADKAARPYTADGDAHIVVGCTMPLFQVQKCLTTGDGNNGRIIYNNRLLCAQISSSSALTINNGFAIVQNLFETDDSDFAAASLHAFADGDLTTIDNYVDMYNTAVGERASRLYNDVLATKVVPSGVQKYGASRYSIYDNYNIKADTFPDAVGNGSVGTWAYDNGVGNAYILSLFGAVNRSASDLPHNDNTPEPYMGNAWLKTSQPNLGRTSLGYTKANIMDMFTNYTVAPRAVPAIGGNYVPLSTATNFKIVPANQGGLVYDLAGVARETDGTGAIGAYEAAP